MPRGAAFSSLDEGCPARRFCDRQVVVLHAQQHPEHLGQQDVDHVDGAWRTTGRGTCGVLCSDPARGALGHVARVDNHLLRRAIFVTRCVNATSGNRRRRVGPRHLSIPGRWPSLLVDAGNPFPRSHPRSRIEVLAEGALGPTTPFAPPGLGTAGGVRAAGHAPADTGARARCQLHKALRVLYSTHTARGPLDARRRATAAA